VVTDAKTERLLIEAAIMRDRIARLCEALEDIREWAGQDDIISFDDGDISVADYCDRALRGYNK